LSEGFKTLNQIVCYIAKRKHSGGKAKWIWKIFNDFA